MIKFTPLNMGTFTKKNNYQEVVSMISQAGFDLINLGESSVPEYNIYGISVGDTTKKPVIYLQGQIHGAHEWRATHFILEFMKILKNPPASHATYIEQIKKDFSFYAIPCLNPYGYENNTYYNANGVNLNRNYDYNWANYDDSNDPYPKGSSPFSEPETQISRDVVLDLKPMVAMDWHCRGGFSVGNTHFMGTNLTDEYDLIMKEIIQSLNMCVTDNTMLLNIKTNRPMASTWFGSLNNKYGRKTFGLLPEVGSLETEVKQGIQGINMIFITVFIYWKYFYKKITRIYKDEIE